MLETLKNILDLIDEHDSNCDSTYDYDRRIIIRDNNYQINGKNSVELETLKDSYCVLSLLSYDEYDDFNSLVNDKNYLEEVNENLEEENKKLKEEIEELKKLLKNK